MAMEGGEDGAAGPSDSSSSVERSRRLATLRKRKQRSQCPTELKRQRTEEERLHERSKHAVESLHKPASQKLLQCVQQELGLEQKILTQLPNISKFETSIAGSLATLHCKHNQEEVTVQLNANHAVEVSYEEDDDEDQDTSFVPVFTVSVTKPSGDCLRFDCSFDEYGAYGEKGSAWDSMNIDAVTVVPVGSEEADSIYSTETQNLSEELCEALLQFLVERHINKQFANEILQFYKAFEHRCYVTNFLEGLKKYCTQ